MKDTHTWITMLIGIGYMIFKIIRVIEKHKAEPTHQPEWEVETEEELLPKWEELKWPIEKAQEIAKHKQEIRTSRLELNQTNISTNQSSKSISDPSYPGIQKLLLSTQEQNPYKLYKVAATRRNKKLNQVLNMYNSSHKAIIMAELFGSRPWV